MTREEVRRFAEDHLDIRLDAWQVDLVVTLIGDKQTTGLYNGSRGGRAAAMRVAAEWIEDELREQGVA